MKASLSRTGGDRPFWETIVDARPRKTPTRKCSDDKKGPAPGGAGLCVAVVYAAVLRFSSLRRLATINAMHNMKPMAQMGPATLMAFLMKAPESTLGVL